VVDSNSSSSHNNNDVVDASSSSGDAGYCYCKRGDFDDMISCDNDCPIGWFHYSCLKLTEEDVLKGKYTVQNAIRRSLRLRRKRNKSKLLEN